MKPTYLRTLVLLAAFLPAFAFGAKDSKRPKKPAAPQDGAAAEVLKNFDKNDNQQIDADELPALQKAFSIMKNLDKNANGEIELAEVERPKEPAAAGRKDRAAAGLKKVDKNGNHKIDAEEVEELQKVIANSPMMKKLDQNGNGKLDADEIERLNQRTEKGGGKRHGSAATPAPSVRKAPEKAVEAETPKVEEKKPEIPATDPQPPGNFGN